MKGLIFIRHAETNLAGTFCGHTDPPLNARGRTQVAELIKRLASEAIEEIYSSDLLRATETANALAKAISVPCDAKASLREINFGAWEAMTWTEIEKTDPDFALRWTQSFPDLTAPQGEPFSAFRSRVLREIEGLVRCAERRRIAVVSHSGVMQLVLRELLGKNQQEAWELTQTYCCSFLYTNAPAFEEVVR